MCLSLRSNRDGDCSIIKTRTFATASIPCALIVSTTCVAAQLDVKERLPKSCPILTLMLNTEIERMIRLQERAKKEEKVPPSDLLSAWRRTFGKKEASVALLREMKKVRQRADTLNAALRTSACATIDIDQALKISVAPRP